MRGSSLISKKLRLALLAVFPLGANLGGVHSDYTELVLQIAEHYPTPAVQIAKPDPQKPILLRCLETKDHPLYIGLEQMQWIDAPIDRVAQAVDDIDRYTEIFPGFAQIKITRRDQNKWETYWEQKIPVPLVPNVRYEMTYLIDRSSPARRIYRYQLKASKDLIASDGVIILERDPADSRRTRYTEYDFYDAHWGLAKTFGQDRLWRENVEGIALSDLGLRLKAENPDKNGEWIRTAARKLLFSTRTDHKCENKAPATSLLVR